MIPKKPALGLDPRVGTGFWKDHASSKKLERDDDSTKSHPALMLVFRKFAPSITVGGAFSF
jgi:hypothetical protein